MNLNDYAFLIGTTRRAKGFITPSALESEIQRHDMLGKLMLIVSECSEAAEAVRSMDYENFKEELADVIIRTLDIFDAMQIDADITVAAKMSKNNQRPPLHGRKVRL